MERRVDIAKLDTGADRDLVVYRVGGNVVELGEIDVQGILYRGVILVRTVAAVGGQELRERYAPRRS